MHGKLYHTALLQRIDEVSFNLAWMKARHGRRSGVLLSYKYEGYCGNERGVDSSVAAYLLKKQGHEVEGVSFILYEARMKKYLFRMLFHGIHS